MNSKISFFILRQSSALFLTLLAWTSLSFAGETAEAVSSTAPVPAAQNSILAPTETYILSQLIGNTQPPTPSGSTKPGVPNTQVANPKACIVTGVAAYDRTIQEMLENLEGPDRYRSDGGDTVYGIGRAPPGDSFPEQNDANCKAANLSDLESKYQPMALQCAEYCFNKYYLTGNDKNRQLASIMSTLYNKGGPEAVFAWSQLILNKPKLASDIADRWVKKLGPNATAQDVKKFVGYFMDEQADYFRKIGGENNTSTSKRMVRVHRTNAVIECYEQQTNCNADEGLVTSGTIANAMRAGVAPSVISAAGPAVAATASNKVLSTAMFGDDAASTAAAVVAPAAPAVQSTATALPSAAAPPTLVEPVTGQVLSPPADISNPVKININNGTAEISD